MASLKGILGKEIEDLIQESHHLFDKKDYKKSIDVLIKAWDKLPEDKNQYDESFYIVSYILDTALFIKDIQTMNEWVDKIFYADPERGDYGQREMWAGKVAFESNQKEKALEYFKIANKKSKGRLFSGENAIYKDFLNEKITELSDEIYTEITNLTDKGNKFIEKNKLSDAIDCFNKALDLVPSPKSDWEAATWIYTALGDVYFLNKNYSQALENLHNAFNCPGGYANPFILLRMGQSFLETKITDKARECLLKAYMLEGKDIFKYEKPKYFNLIKDLVDDENEKESKFSLLFKKFKSQN
ncbi:hypothetical protein [Flavobacterium ginsenosidimutans]|uniref:hypothetical protein n=1 Tax=Flavobacterium ginsenosidimutans TaxID=687844 RepID=UPI001950F50A|nr:hypothetical protein [Flavobacterium ginsenosidimutans]